MNGGVEFEDDRDSCTVYRFTREDIDAVNVANWYEKFKEISPKTILLPIPPEVLKYLKSDAMLMPQDTHTTAHLNLKRSCDGAGGGTHNGVDEEDDDDNGSWASISDGEEAPNIPSEFLQKISRGQRRGNRRVTSEGSVEEEFGDVGEEEWEIRRNESGDSSEDDDEGQIKKLMEVEKFHEFDSLLDASIKKLGDAVIPKINRKSPKDAIWIGFNRSLKCYNPGDIYLLLKTSDVVSHLLEDPYSECCDESLGEGSASSRLTQRTSRGRISTGTTCTSPYTLVLKEWKDSWGPEMEFRCFICSNHLVAICQRDVDTCYSSIVNRKDKLLLNIQNFFLKNIRDQFPVDFYIMDIVCHPNGEIYVVDFDVFGMCTDPLLFTYKELESVFEDFLNCSSSANKEDNRMRDSVHQSRSTDAQGQPCLRFLTESRNFRARKSSEHSALANDVMTYIRESVAKK